MSEDNESSPNVCRCPDCGTARVVHRSKRDPIDRMSKSPSSVIAKWMGGKLYHCIFCRLQFYSTRPKAVLPPEEHPLHPGERPPSAA